MAKQHLKFVKEIQCRGFDELVGHTSIGFMIMFLAYLNRVEREHRTFRDLFYACWLPRTGWYFFHWCPPSYIETRCTGQGDDMPETIVRKQLRSFSTLWWKLLWNV